MTDLLAVILPLSSRPVRHSPPCPRCRTALTLGPVIFWCPACHRDVHASLIDHEVRCAA